MSVRRREKTWFGPANRRERPMLPQAWRYYVYFVCVANGTMVDPIQLAKYFDTVCGFFGDSYLDA
jgi:hypothetical protein